MAETETYRESAPTDAEWEHADEDWDVDFEPDAEDSMDEQRSYTFRDGELWSTIEEEDGTKRQVPNSEYLSGDALEDYMSAMAALETGSAYEGSIRWANGDTINSEARTVMTYELQSDGRVQIRSSLTHQEKEELGDSDDFYQPELIQTAAKPENPELTLTPVNTSSLTANQTPSGLKQGEGYWLSRGSSPSEQSDGLFSYMKQIKIEGLEPDAVDKSKTAFETLFSAQNLVDESKNTSAELMPVIKHEEPASHVTEQTRTQPEGPTPETAKIDFGVVAPESLPQNKSRELLKPADAPEPGGGREEVTAEQVQPSESPQQTLETNIIGTELTDLMASVDAEQLAKSLDQISTNEQATEANTETDLANASSEALLEVAESHSDTIASTEIASSTPVASAESQTPLILSTESSEAAASEAIDVHADVIVEQEYSKLITKQESATASNQVEHVAHIAAEAPKVITGDVEVGSQLAEEATSEIISETGYEAVAELSTEHDEWQPTAHELREEVMPPALTITEITVAPPATISDEIASEIPDQLSKVATSPVIDHAATELGTSPAQTETFKPQSHIPTNERATLQTDSEPLAVSLEATYQPEVQTASPKATIVQLAPSTAVANHEEGIEITAELDELRAKPHRVTRKNIAHMSVGPIVQELESIPAARDLDTPPLNLDISDSESIAVRSMVEAQSPILKAETPSAPLEVPSDARGKYKIETKRQDVKLIHPAADPVRMVELQQDQIVSFSPKDEPVIEQESGPEEAVIESTATSRDHDPSLDGTVSVSQRELESPDESPQSLSTASTGKLPTAPASITEVAQTATKSTSRQDLDLKLWSDDFGSSTFITGSESYWPPIVQELTNAVTDESFAQPGVALFSSDDSPDIDFTFETDEISHRPRRMRQTRTATA